MVLPDRSRVVVRLLGLASLVLWAACADRTDPATQGRDSLAASAESSAARDSLASVTAPVRSERTLQPDSLVRVSLGRFGGLRTDTTDRGTGLVALRIVRDASRQYPRADSLIFRDAPRDDARIAGALVVERAGWDVWEYAAILPPALPPNVIRYRYDELGVPTDSIDATGRWVRGILAFRNDRTPLHGWAKLDEPRTIAMRWVDSVPVGIVSFLDPVSARVYATLDDARAGVSGEPPPARHEFEKILERQGQWLRVRMRWPYDSCSDRLDGTDAREVWIRYIDDRGRPLVFPRTGGC